jgi:hypothetical protein
MAFYDLKVNIMASYAQLQPGEQRSEHDILLYLFLGSYKINIIKACTAQAIFTPFSPVFQ